MQLLSICLERALRKGPEGLQRLTTLPTGEVGGNLCLNASNITVLPDVLRVGGNLYLFGSPVSALPQDLKVGGKIVGFQEPQFGSAAAAAARTPSPGAI